MSEPSFSLDAESVSALADMVARDRADPIQQTGPDPGAWPYPGSRVINLVKITSATKTGNFYPGVWYQYLPASDTFAAQTLGIWVRAPNGSSLSTGVYYRGVIAGPTLAGVLVFLVDDSAAGANALTMQVDGTLIGTEPIFDFLTGSGVTLTGTNDPTNTRAKLMIAAGGGGLVLVAKTVWASNGSYTWTPNADTTLIVVEMVGGGGGGGGCTGGTSTYSAGGGGAGGTYARYTANYTSGTPQSIVVGAGGAGGTSGGGSGSNGSASSFEATVVEATGGGGGNGMSATSTGRVVNGGEPDVSGTGDLFISGSPGGAGVALPVQGVLIAGQGGNSFWGGAAYAPVDNNSAANSGTTGGGGGGASSNSASSFAGGAGGDGVVIITEYGT